MAEAAALDPSSTPSGHQRVRYFCHECADSVELNIDATILACPKCDSCFIEELTQELESDNLHTDDSYNRDPLSFLRSSSPSRFFSGMLLRSVRPDEDDDIDSDDDDDDDDDLYHFLREEPPPPLALSQTEDSATAFSRDRNNRQSALHQILEQLLENLRPGSQSGQTSHSFPLLFQGFHGDPRDYAWGADGLDNVITELLNQSEGTGAPPATKEDIDVLPSFTITQNCIDKSSQCSVCLEDFALDEVAKCLPCEHVFHCDCVIPWLQLHRTCPICRKPVGGESVGNNLVGAPVVIRGTEEPSGSDPSVASSDSSIFEDAFEDADREQESSAIENVMDVDLCYHTDSSDDL